MKRRGTDQRVFGAVVGLALTFAMLSWLPFEYLKAITPDIFWLMGAAGKLLHGARMVDAVYDPSPPLSIAVYIPAYLLSHCGISEELAVIVTTLAYAFVSCLAVYALGRRIVGRDEALVVTISFFLAETVLSTAEFGQRDQIIVFSLLPFVLGQILLTRRIACPRLLLYVVFASGAVLVLLKPHFGLVPAVFLIHRGIVQKRWSVVRDPDFVLLSLFSILYVASVWLFFRDYAVVILPDVLKLYLPAARNMIVPVYSVILFFIYLDVLMLLGLIERRIDARISLVRPFVVCAMLCIIPYLVQMKDFRYHALPSLTFLWTGLGLIIFTLARQKLSPGLSAALMIGLFSIAGYAAEPPSSYMTKIQAESQPLTRLVAACGPNCRFTMLDEVVRTTLIAQRYADKESSSRFPSLWFLPRLASLPDGPDRDRLFHKYAGFLAEDLSSGRPDLIISCNERFNYVGYFSRDDKFARAVRPYGPDGTVGVDYGAFYPEAPRGLLKKYECQIYRRGKAGR